MTNEGNEDTSASLGQLFRYMVLNKVRYGALSSANQTYFCFFEDKIEGKSMKVAGNVYVSKAWFLGEKHYLRAWAKLWSLSCQATPYDNNEIEWVNINLTVSDEKDGEGAEDDEQQFKEGTSSNERFSGSVSERTRSNTSNMGGVPKKRKRNVHGQDVMSSLHSTFIPIVPFSSIKFFNSIGYGRNGYVFRAQWEGKKLLSSNLILPSPKSWTGS